MNQVHGPEPQAIAFAWLSLLSGAFLLQSAAAHHAASEYDTRKIVEIEGTLVEYRWQNPHVQLRVRSGTDAQGKPMIWDLEGSSLSVMRRTNATPEKLRVGDKIRVAGEPSMRAPNRMFALHVLQADGTEIVFMPGMRPRWSATAIGGQGTWFDPGTAENASAGIFRVWSSKLNDVGGGWPASFPLTEAGRAKVKSWDPVNDTVTKGCEPKGMPTIMGQPYPMEFVKKNDTILLRMEEYDTVRTIHMSERVVQASLPTHPLGRSTGRWDGTTLVVTTDGITWPYLAQDGTPLSPQASLVERFTPSPDGTRLRYSMVITDPVYLSKPVQLMRSWVARPNESVKPYNCGNATAANRD